MHCALLIPDGVGVRNFVLGRFLCDLSSQAAVSVFHIIPPELLETYSAPFHGRVNWEPMQPYSETPLSFTLRYSLSYAQMYWAKTTSMRHNLTLPVKGSWRTKAAHRTARVTGRLAASPRRIKALEAAHCKASSQSPAVARYEELFEQIRPTVLFCSHQRPPEVLPAVLAARRMKIPTATFIFSWDNITSKGRIAAPFDHYLVWSEHMKRELLKYYPDVNAARIHIVGTPQFDPYADESLLWPREDFFRRIGADPERPLICYSGGDTGNCPEDQDHLRVLMQAIREGDIRRSPQVVLRPCPVDDGCRYMPVKRDYPELIVAMPAWTHTRPGEWSRVIPLPEDVAMLANLTHHCDLNVNFGSTMTLDFGIHDKPVVNVAFDVANPPVFGLPVWDFSYKFEHYTNVVKLGAARFGRSAGEFVQHVNDYLENPSLDRDNRRRLMDMQVGAPLGESSRRIVDVLRDLSN